MVGLKKRQNRIKKEWLFLMVMFPLIIVLFFLLSVNFKLYQKRKSISSEINRFKTKIAELEQEREVMTAKISQDQLPDYLEKVAREEFNLKKEGEEAVAFPLLTDEQREEEEVAKERNLLQKILEKLKAK